MNKRDNLPLSVIIPVYNEEKYLGPQINKLYRLLHRNNISRFEVIIIENGSRDNSLNVLCTIKKNFSNLKILRLPYARYGEAVRKGIEEAKYNYVVQFDIDFISIVFLKKAFTYFPRYDIVVGSKLMKSSYDKRPFIRILISKLFSIVIRKIFQYRGTDTHGIKAYKKKAIISLIQETKSGHHFFDTELLLRSQANKLRIKEIPVETKELRPTRFPTALRIFQSIPEFISMVYRLKHKFPQTNRNYWEADDFGLNDKANMEMQKLDSKGRLNTISLLGNAQYLPIDFKTETKLALHINFVEGKPISRAETVKSIVDAKGNFYSLPVFVLRLFLKQISAQHIEKEMWAQLNRVKKMGYLIFELNSHQHVHALSPIAEITAKVARRYSISRIRSYGNIKVFSFESMTKKMILKFAAYLSKLIWFKIWTLPSSWTNKHTSICFMSWEAPGQTVWKRIQRQKDLHIVIHPGLPYDRNTQYRLISLKNGYS